MERGQLRADPAKVKAVVEWPVSRMRKLLQKFPGFANFSVVPSGAANLQSA